MRRPLKSKPLVVVAPVMISQLNCAAICGVDPRRFLELLLRLDIRVAKIGKLRLVDAEEFRVCLYERMTPSTSPSAPVDLERQPETADEVLAVLGLRVTR